jgi:riboflavin transporter FmnP
MYILIPIISAILLGQSVKINNYIVRSIAVYITSAGMFIGIILAFVQIVSAQW